MLDGIPVTLPIKLKQVEEIYFFGRFNVKAGTLKRVPMRSLRDS